MTSKLSEHDEVVLATHNAGKLSEFREFLTPYIAKLTSSAEELVDSPEETGSTFVENALIKARFVSQKTGQIALADDSGLSIPVLGGQPGLHSAEYFSKFDRPEDVFKDLEYQIRSRKIDPDKDPVEAVFFCVLVIYWPDGRFEVIEETCPGYLAFPGRGEHGHGYDPIFCPDSSDLTFAQMSLKEKEHYSHRGKALRELVKNYVEK